MKNLSKIMFWMALLPLLFVLSCKDDDPVPADDNFSKLSTYLVDSNLDLNNILDGWIKPAPAPEDVATFLDTYHIFDIRSADDYAAGHIEGAVNTTLGTIVADASSVSKPILVVCYTGQTAGHATVALRLSDHTDAAVLKWGMSGWNSSTDDKWQANSGAVNGVYGVGHTNWKTDATASLQEYANPTFTTTSADPAEMLAERVAVMTGGFKGVSSHTVIDSPDDYFINNYWDEASVTRLGHISDASRIQPMTLAGDNFKNLDPSKQIVTYCWTGQTSSMITAYLTVLGYNATSLTYGVNSLIWSELEAGSGEADASHTYKGAPNDLPLIVE